ncbi:MAG: hypothetical protein U5K56_01945 [Halioglobus sp.]|nr:hypothetical protein [Halioglobus sp.]
MPIDSSRTPRGVAAVAVAAAFALIASVSLAQPMLQGQGGGAAQGGQAGALMQQLQAKSKELEALNQQLTELRDKAIEANPELAEQRDALQSSLETGMKDAGYDMTEGRARIEELQGQMQSGELSAEEQQEKGQALRSEFADMREAQGAAMEDAEFKKRRQALNEDMIAAMKEVDPRAEALIQELQVAQREYQQLAQQAMQQRGGAQ